MAVLNTALEDLPICKEVFSNDAPIPKKTLNILSSVKLEQRGFGIKARLSLYRNISDTTLQIAQRPLQELCVAKIQSICELLKYQQRSFEHRLVASATY